MSAEDVEAGEVVTYGPVRITRRLELGPAARAELEALAAMTPAAREALEAAMRAAVRGHLEARLRLAVAPQRWAPGTGATGPAW